MDERFVVANPHSCREVGIFLFHKKVEKRAFIPMELYRAVVFCNLRDDFVLQVIGLWEGRGITYRQEAS